jgi:hypothetical protein
MNKPTPNPFLTQLVANIASKADQGRILDVAWGKKGIVLLESRKKKAVKEGNMAPKKVKPDNTEEEPAADKPADDVVPQGADEAPPEQDAKPEGGQEPSLPSLGGSAPDAGGGDVPPAPDAGGEEAPPEEDAGEAQADAAKSKAELEKAKAEKDQAEKEIKKQSYVHLVSAPGVHFLLGKLVDHAFKTNTIDTLASEMTQKLKIQTPEDFGNFGEEMAAYKAIPGVAELLASMKGMATKQPEATEEEPVAENEANDELDEKSTTVSPKKPVKDPKKDKKAPYGGGMHLPGDRTKSNYVPDWKRKEQW